MILNIPLEDLFASQLDVILDSNGRLCCKFSPSSGRYNPLAPQICRGLTLNVESEQSEDGCMLSLSVSPDENSALSIPKDSPTALEDMWCHTFDSLMDTGGDSPMSLLLADSYPPPDCHSTYNYATFSIPRGELEHQYDLDLTSHHTPADVNGNLGLSSGQLSELMGIAPVPHGRVCPSDSKTAAPSCRPSPLLSSSGLPFLTFENASPNSSSAAASPDLAFVATTWSSPQPGEPPVEENAPPSKAKRRAQYPCLHPCCDRVLTSPYTRQVHMRTHRAKPAFVCTMGCGEDFTRQHDRERHEVALHGKKCKHTCKRCRRFFSSNKMLVRHICRGHRQGAIRWPLEEEESKSENSEV